MTRIASLFDDDVLTAEVDPRLVEVVLDPLEAALVEQAVEKRRREFAAGRRLAHGLLARLGASPSPLVNGEDRAPIWPRGFVGSISHTDGYCAVAVAREGDVEAVGLDVERAEPLKPALFKMVCTPKEREWLASLDEASAGRLGKLIFGAKECAYKCQYVRSRTFLGFQAMRIEVDERASTFTAVFEQPAGTFFAPGDRIEGRFRYDADLVLTGTTLRRT